MIRARIGVFLREARLTVVALGRHRLEHFTVDEAEDPAATLAAELRARGLTGSRVRLGLDRRQVVVKKIELPRIDGGDVGRMVGFDLERHMPFPPEEARVDWVELPSGPEDPRRVLVAAAEARIVERPLALVAAARRRPAALTVACHALTTLLPRELPPRHAVWAHRHDGVVDLLFLDGRALLTSRQVAGADGAALAREVRRSLPIVRWSTVDDVWLSGDGAAPARVDLAATLGATVPPPPFARAFVPLVAALPAEHTGAALLALGLAAAPRNLALNLLPVPARPWAPSRGQLVTVGVAGIVALLGLSFGLAHVVRTERYLARVGDEVRRLEPEAKAVDSLVDDLSRKRRVLAALESAQASRIQVLPVLHELTETMPAGAWLQSLAMDRQGVELIGQAEGASTLIPLLEASSRLERVEFTSPVTKTQNKDQFRLRAAWEAQAPHPQTPHPTLSPRGERRRLFPLPIRGRGQGEGALVLWPP